MANYQINNQPAAEIFRAYDIRGIVDKTLFASDYYAIGKVFASLLKKRAETPLLLVVMLILSPMFYDAMVSGLTEGGVKVVYIGGTAARLNYATKFIAPDGIMITASRNPKDYNGIKLIWTASPFLKKKLPKSS